MTGVPAHVPVMLVEALAALRLPEHKEGVWIDGTFGGGGHCAAMLQRLGPGACLLAFDKDPAAAGIARQRFGGDDRFRFRQGSFATLEDHVRQQGLEGRVAGILFDLGVSSPQLDDPARGFSFLRDGPLDMRMDPGSGPSAAEWLAQAGEAEIARVLKTYGEERFHRRVARAIVQARGQAAIATTDQLARVVADANPRWEKHKHPATRVFQAIRIQVNRELDDLLEGLRQALAVLAPAGRLVVISFHSLEDRIVKTFMRDQARGVQLPRRLPVTGSPAGGLLRLVGKPLRPSAKEIVDNPRARSAVLRVAERRV